jgi:hypothetical protein
METSKEHMFGGKNPNRSSDLVKRILKCIHFKKQDVSKIYYSVLSGNCLKT